MRPISCGVRQGRGAWKASAGSNTTRCRKDEWNLPCSESRRNGFAVGPSPNALTVYQLTIACHRPIFDLRGEPIARIF